MLIQILVETLFCYESLCRSLSVFVLILREDGFLNLKSHGHDDVKVFASVQGIECIAYSQNAK